MRKTQRPPEQKGKQPKPADKKDPRGSIKLGIKKGKPEPLPRGAMRVGQTVDGCHNCVIRALNGQPFPPGTTTATNFLPETTIAFVINATPNPANCPCTWSNELYVEYVAVLTGAAKLIKRKNLQFPQILELIKIDPHNPQNPYATIAGCRLTISIKQLNADLRAGINTQHAFFQGVPTRIKLGVKCNSAVRTIVINITDP